MAIIKRYLILVFLITLNIVSVARGQRSPCPALFQYQIENDYKYGVFYWYATEIGQTYVVDFELTLPGRLPSNYYGEVTLLEGKERALQNILRQLPIVYKVIFPLQSPIPTVTEIRVNDNVVCTGPPNQGGSVTRINLKHTLQTQTGLNLVHFMQPTLPPDGYRTDNYGGVQAIGQLPNQLPPAPTPTKKQPVAQRPISQPVTQKPTTTPQPPTTEADDKKDILNKICGKLALPTPLVVGGKDIQRGSWPWLVAVYVNNPKSLSFHCGGSLISARTVISSAHCFKLSGVEYTPDNILIVAGRFNLLKWNELGSVTLGVERISIHPDYRDDLSNFDGDLAVIILKQSVSFSQYIRPVCLWNESSDLRDIEGEEGITVGWGRDEKGREVIPEPKKISATIVSESSCLRSNDNFFHITSNRTICAGMRDGSGPCTGDSGGGLMINRHRRWFIRGTVSGSLSETNLNKCDLNQYVVYSDIAKFMSWIKPQVKF